MDQHDAGLRKSGHGMGVELVPPIGIMLGAHIHTVSFGEWYELNVLSNLNGIKGHHVIWLIHPQSDRKKYPGDMK